MKGLIVGKPGAGLGPSKNWVIWGRPKILLETGGNLEKGGVDIQMGGRLPLFYYFTVQLHLLCVWGKSKVSLLHCDSSIFGVSSARFSS